MLQSMENISSYVQCKWLNVLSVYFHFNTLSCQIIFSRGHGGCTKCSGNSRGVGGRGGGGVILVVQKWKFRGGGGGGGGLT